jgi:hypothetical protein
MSLARGGGRFRGLLDDAGWAVAGIEAQNPPTRVGGFREGGAGDGLLSRALSSGVPSAL